tara:strand:+ start:70 stop:537 length:468 start_codon:yes stop_codon:yes gene_type:complete
MVKKTYQTEISKENTARAYTANAGVSLKYATEICNRIKKKPVDKAEAFLTRIAAHEDFLPLRKYTRKVAHRKGESKSGVKSGRYPEKTCEAFIGLLGSVKANADFKGLDQEKLQIIHAFASMGFKRSTFQSKGRIGGKRRRKKSTHIEVIVREAK